MVDCDTLDASIAESLGPFEDCTSNQAIAFGELQEHRHKNMIQESVGVAKRLSSTYPSISTEALAVEIAVCSRVCRRSGV